MKTMWLRPACWMTVALTFATAQPVVAQQVSIVIRDGEVYINGSRMSRDELARSLPLKEFALTVDLGIDQGHALRTIEVDGVRFVAAGHEHSRADDAYSLKILADTAAALSYDNGLWVVGQRARELALDLKQTTRGLRVTLEDSDLHEEAGLALQAAQAQIAEAATTLQLLPDLHIVRYYGHVAQADTGLYSRLRQEWVMEREVQQLAVEITLMPSGPERDAKVESLHRRLDAIFERKLDNRRLEIGQLEARLEALQDRLERREALRSSMVERRLEEMLGQVRQ